MSSQHKATWSSREAAFTGPLGPLGERLAHFASDRVSPAPELTLETAAHLLQWVFEQPLEWSWPEAREALDAGLVAWAREQGWRGPCARLLDSLSRAAALELEGLGPREVFAEELGLWVAREEAGEAVWSGEPLAAGRRLLDPAGVREHALHGRGAGQLTRGERILVVPPTDLIEPALEAAWKEALEPAVITGEGGPHRDGLRLARRLAEAGVDVAVAYDAALVRHVDQVDRIWIGTEATDGSEFLAPLGTEALLVRARALEVPAELFVTRSERLPAARKLAPPAWGARDQWMLWEHAPAGVEVLSQTHETVTLDLIDQIVSDVGRGAPARLAQATHWPVDDAAPRGARAQFATALVQ